MKRTILTLLAVGVLVPLAAGSAKAGPDRERKDVSVRADRNGISIAYQKVEARRDHRASRDRRDNRDQRGYRGHRGPGDDRYRYSGRRNKHVAFRIGFHPRRDRWVAGHWAIEERHVRTPDRVERVWVPARYEMRRDACGHPHRVLVAGGHHVERVIPGRVIVKHERVWVPGHWERF